MRIFKERVSRQSIQSRKIAQLEPPNQSVKIKDDDFEVEVVGIIKKDSGRFEVKIL